MSSLATTRPLAALLEAQPTSDGAGVRLYRSIGAGRLPQLDPFLLLDEFRSDRADDYIAGFPNHPHRGFETVTYMLAGRMRHADNQGNQGLLQSGGAQWMTAGRGIVHSEMPEQEDGLMWGFQLWVNLPAAEKMRPPRYQDIEPGQIPEVTRADGSRLRMVAGTLAGVTGPVADIVTQPLFVDVSLPAGAVFAEELPAGHTAFVYIFEGAAKVADSRLIERGRLAVLGAGERVEVQAGEQGARFILVAARPLKEPVARYGPFVMNTEAEIRQAFADYQGGRF